MGRHKESDKIRAELNKKARAISIDKDMSRQTTPEDDMNRRKPMTKESKKKRWSRERSLNESEENDEGIDYAILLAELQERNEWDLQKIKKAKKNRDPRIVKQLREQLRYHKNLHGNYKVYSKQLEYYTEEKEQELVSKSTDIAALEEERDRREQNILFLNNDLEREKAIFEGIKHRIDELNKYKKLYKQVVSRREAKKSSEEPVQHGRPKKNFEELSKSGKHECINRILNQLRSIYNEEEVREIIRKLSKKISSNNIQSQLSVPETIVIFHRTSLTVRKQRMLRNYLREFNTPIFASERQTRAFLKELTVDFKIVAKNVKINDFTEVEVVQVKDVRKVIEKRLMLLVSSGSFMEIPIEKYSDEIWLSLNMDKGGDHVKFAIGLVNKNGALNSIENLTLVACYEGPEDPLWLRACFSDIARQVDMLNEVEIKNRKFRIRKFIIADYKLCMLLFGLTAVGVLYFCIKCLAPKEGKYNAFEILKSYKARGNNSGIDPEYSKTRQSLFSSVPPAQYNLPLLHIFLGLGDQLVEILKKEIVRFDAQHLSEEEIAIKMKELHKNPELKVISKELNEIDAKICAENEGLSRLREILNQLSSGVDDFGEMLMEDDKCSVDPCLAHELNLLLPPRTFADWYQCDHCSQWSHSFCLFHDHDEVVKFSKKKYRCNDCSLFHGEHSQKLKSSQQIIDLFTKVLRKDILMRETSLGKYNKRRDEVEFKMNKKLFQLNDQLGIESKKWKKALEHIGVTECLYFMKFTGNHLKQIISKIDKLIGYLAPELQQVNEVIYACDALRMMGEIQDISYCKFMNEKEQVNFSETLYTLLSHMIDKFPFLNVTYKAHLLYKHSEEFIREFHNFQLLSEQGIESLHSWFSKQQLRTTNRNKYLKIARIFLWQFEINCINDSLPTSRKDKSTRPLAGAIFEEEEEEQNIGDISMPTVGSSVSFDRSYMEVEAFEREERPRKDVPSSSKKLFGCIPTRSKSIAKERYLPRSQKVSRSQNEKEFEQIFGFLNKRI